MTWRSGETALVRYAWQGRTHFGGPAIVVEDDGALGAAMAAASILRSAGLSVELVATGSPRKRFDRAVKKGAREIVVLGFTDGGVTRRVKSNDTPRVEALLVS